MLDLEAQKQSPGEVIAQLPCNVQLPADLERDFERTGPVPACPNDGRQSHRVYWRGAEFTAALEYQQTLPAVPRCQGWHRVYIVDISKRGISLLHSEQLFPGERMRTLLVTGDHRTVQIAWCRRLGDRCFRVGARFVKTGKSR